MSNHQTFRTRATQRAALSVDMGRAVASPAA